MVKKKKLKNRRWFKVLLFIIKIPYFIVKYLYEGIKYIVNLFQKKRKKIKVEKKRKRRYPKYKKFEVIKKEKGSFEKLEKSFLKDKGKIGIILGGRGSGKTAMGIKLLENIYAKTKKKCFSIGMKKEDLPSWIKSIENPEEIENNSFVLVDEGGVLFSSRKSMSNANKVLSDLILLSRHKGINILFISQNSSNLEVNILRQADFMILKPSSLLQKNFERKIVQKIYEKTEKDFKKLKGKSKEGLTYIYSDEFRGFISNPLPSFWEESLSKSFK